MLHTLARATAPAIAADRPDEAPEQQAAHGAAPAILGLTGISLAFGGVTALAGIDLAVGRGEIRAVIGPNGAGKSSLINVVTGLYRPGSGRIRIAGEVFHAVPTERLARLGVARTFQNLALFRGLSVLDNVATGGAAATRAGFLAEVAGMPWARAERRDAIARAEAMLEFLELAEVRHRLASTLSYGLQKRVELARALVARPRLLLLDEPMAGMTATDKQEMARFIRAARDGFGTTVVLIEHDIGVVMGLSDRVAVLDYGRKIADGPPDVVRRDPAVIAAYLGAEDGEAAR